jgi:hypothetical protein
MWTGICPSMQRVALLVRSLLVNVVPWRRRREPIDEPLPARIFGETDIDERHAAGVLDDEGLGGRADP